jgi:hypothetical protein
VDRLDQDVGRRQCHRDFSCACLMSALSRASALLRWASGVPNGERSRARGRHRAEAIENAGVVR